jgi:GNAT superfamily N-acetyltransferase
MVSDIRIRCASAADLPAFLKHRRALFIELGQDDSAKLDAMEAAFFPWAVERMRRGELILWLAEESGGTAAASATLWIRDWVPQPVDLSGRRAHVLNVYTAPAFRRQGLARRLMDTLLAWCRDNTIRSVTLRPTDAGRELYRSLGFEHDEFMMKRLPGD